MKIRGRTIALLKFFAGQMLFPMPNQMSKHWWQKLLLTIFGFCLTRFIFCSYSRLFQLHQNGNCEGQFKHILHRLDVVLPQNKSITTLKRNGQQNGVKLHMQKNKSCKQSEPHEA